jgi:hypothetical protein
VLLLLLVVDLQSHKPDVSHAAWAGLDSLDSGIKIDNDDDWGLRHFGSAAVNSARNPHPRLKLYGV